MKPSIPSWLISLGWALILGIVAGYFSLWMVESGYGVPLEARSFRFERGWAALLCVAPLLAWAAQAVLHRRHAPRIRLSRARDVAVVARRTPRSWVAPALPAARAVALTLFAVGLMGPQSIHAREQTEVNGIDLVLTLDLSLSMQAADIVPNRFDAMKAVVDDFVRRRPNDRIGAVVFARDAFTLMPLTTDKEALRHALSQLELGMIDGRGTAIGNALGTALNRLRHSTAKSRVIVLLTDGDSNSGNVSADQAGELATTMGVRVYTVLMGQTDQTRTQTGVDLFGRPIWQSGEFPINPELMARLAENSGAESFVAGDRQSLERSFHDILDSLERSEIEDAGHVYGELFPAFIGPALLLLLAEFALGTLYLRRWP